MNIATVEVTEAANEATSSPTTKQTLHDLTEPTADAPGLTGEEFEQLVDTKIVRRKTKNRTWGHYAPDFNCPHGRILVIRDGAVNLRLVTIPPACVRKDDIVVNVERVPSKLVKRQTDAQINLLNKLYLRKKFDDELYVEQLGFYLATWTGGDTNVPLAFLVSVQDRLATGFGPSNRFARQLRAEFLEFCSAVYPGLIQAVVETDPLAALVKARTRNEITEGYKRLIAGDPFGPFVFYMACYRMIQSKCTARVYGLRHVSATPSDYAQKAIIRIWQSLPQFKGGPEGIYSWVNKIAYNSGKDCLRDTLEYIKEHVEVVTSQKDEDEVVRPQDNPEISKHYFFSGIHTALGRQLPDWIQGTDRLICDLLRSGQNYKGIGQFMGLPESTIKMRVLRMRSKVGTMLQRKDAYFAQA
jgi:DNA-directed RNA polymerase specialized sigma24 family protein